MSILFKIWNVIGVHYALLLLKDDLTIEGIVSAVLTPTHKHQFGVQLRKSINQIGKTSDSNSFNTSGLLFVAPIHNSSRRNNPDSLTSRRLQKELRKTIDRQNSCCEHSASSQNGFIDVKRNVYGLGRIDIPKSAKTETYKIYDSISNLSNSSHQLNINGGSKSVSLSSKNNNTVNTTREKISFNVKYKGYGDKVDDDVNAIVKYFSKVDDNQNDGSVIKVPVNRTSMENDYINIWKSKLKSRLVSVKSENQSRNGVKAITRKDEQLREDRYDEIIVLPLSSTSVLKDDHVIVTNGDSVTSDHPKYTKKYLDRKNIGRNKLSHSGDRRSEKDERVRRIDKQRKRQRMRVKSREESKQVQNEKTKNTSEKPIYGESKRDWNEGNRWWTVNNDTINYTSYIQWLSRTQPKTQTLGSSLKGYSLASVDFETAFAENESSTVTSQAHSNSVKFQDQNSKILRGSCSGTKSKNKEIDKEAQTGTTPSGYHTATNGMQLDAAVPVSMDASKTTSSNDFDDINGKENSKAIQIFSAATVDVDNDFSQIKVDYCTNLKCTNDGKCVNIEDNKRIVRCQCPLGTTGEKCELETAVRYPRFSGTGYIAFPVLREAFKSFNVHIEFRPDTSDGLLLFSSDKPHTHFDFFSIALVSGKVEFRFDCGTGLGVVRSKNEVKLGKWNVIRVHRKDWYGYLQLNDGPESKGKSKGVFNRMTFREDLYLGGYQHLQAVMGRTGVSQGYSGCVRLLSINGRQYDMRKGAFVGDAIHGVDVDECNARACEKMKCVNGGSCFKDGADTAVCLCPIGTAGSHCQSKLDVQIPSFTGQSYLQYLGLRRSVLYYAEIEIVFSTIHVDGLLLYNGYSTDGAGDFLSISLRNGTVEFRYDLGTGPAIIRSLRPVTVGRVWHVVRAGRKGRSGYLEVDDQKRVEQSSVGAFDQLTLTLDLFIGGHRNYDETARLAEIDTSLVGCIQKVIINDRPLKLLEETMRGVNIYNCVDHPCSTLHPCRNGGKCVPMMDTYRCDCPMGFENSNCQDRKARYRYRYRYRRDAVDI